MGDNAVKVSKLGRAVIPGVAAALMVVACTASAGSEPTVAPAESTTSTGPATAAIDITVELPIDNGGAELGSELLELPVAPTVPSTRPSARPATTQVGVAPVAVFDVTNEGVLAAAVIIVSDGDLESAIVEGLLTEAEAEAALVALEQGTLANYAG